MVRPGCHSPLASFRLRARLALLFVAGAGAWSLAGSAACGGRIPPPERRVLEHDVASWSFRRYQRVVDVEVWVPDNRAVAHTASYAASSAEKRGRLEDGDVVNAFVTEYKDRAGVLRAVVTFSRRLAQESGYVVEERRLGGERVFAIVGHGEAWALWGSGRFVVKIGGRGRRDVPPVLVQAYGRAYPSELGAGWLEGSLPER
jgi:hypothetical protein